MATAHEGKERLQNSSQNSGDETRSLQGQQDIAEVGLTQVVCPIDPNLECVPHFPSLYVQ